MDTCGPAALPYLMGMLWGMCLGGWVVWWLTRNVTVTRTNEWSQTGREG